MGVAIYYVFLVVQMISWILFLQKKQILDIIVSAMFGVPSIVIFNDYFINNVIYDPCEGIPDCMNETGMQLVFAMMLIILAASYSVVRLYISRSRSV